MEDHRCDPAPHNELGGALLPDRGLPDHAIAEFQRAVDLEPGSGAAHAELVRVIELQPGYAAAHFHLGVELASRAETMQAIGHGAKP